MGQAEPVLDLLLAPLVLHRTLQLERGRISRIQSQQLLNLLQGQQIFLLLRAIPRVLQQLIEHLLPLRIVEATPQRRDRLVEVAFDLELSQDFVGELIIALLEGLAGALDARLNARRIEDIERLVARSEEHTSELQSHSFISYAVFCFK